MDFGHHQPVCWRFGWVEERVGLPDVLNVVDSQSGVFEQVGCLPVDLERVVVVELIEIEQLSHQSDCNTNGYRMSKLLAGGVGSLLVDVERLGPPRRTASDERFQGIIGRAAANSSRSASLVTPRRSASALSREASASIEIDTTPAYLVRQSVDVVARKSADDRTGWAGGVSSTSLPIGVGARARRPTFRTSTCAADVSQRGGGVSFDEIARRSVHAAVERCARSSKSAGHSRSASIAGLARPIGLEAVQANGIDNLLCGAAPTEGCERSRTHS